MRLDLSDIISVPGASVSFEFEPDLSGAVSGSVVAVKRPARVSGSVRNSAGVLLLCADVEAVLECECSRCLREFNRPVRLHLEGVLTEKGRESGEPDVFPLDGETADLGEIAATSFILSLDQRLLCREDCKGLCERCGADLNLGSCACKKETDPRLAVLGQLLEDEKQEVS